MSDAINTYLFFNIGVSGVIEFESGPSPVKLCIYSVPREEMQSEEVNMERSGDHYEYKKFEFDPLDDQYVAGTSLSDYQMSFDYYESERLWKYIKSFHGPTCLVAHGCESFHYPILRQALQNWTARKSRVSQSVKFVDFRRFSLDTRAKKGGIINSSLSDTYFLLTGHQFPDEEREMMGGTLSHIQLVLEGAAANSDEFVAWVDEFCEDFVL